MTKDVTETRPALRERAEIEPWRFSNVEKMFEDWLEDVWTRPLPRFWRPGFGGLQGMCEARALDVYEQKDNLIVKAEVPGLTKDEIDISLEGNTLTIEGEKKKEEEVKDDDYYRRERSYGAFSQASNCRCLSKWTR
jgi:HSP20 family protein